MFNAHRALSPTLSVCASIVIAFCLAGLSACSTPEVNDAQRTNLHAVTFHWDELHSRMSMQDVTAIGFALPPAGFIVVGRRTEYRADGLWEVYTLDPRTAVLANQFYTMTFHRDDPQSSDWRLITWSLKSVAAGG